MEDYMRDIYLDMRSLDYGAYHEARKGPKSMRTAVPQLVQAAAALQPRHCICSRTKAELLNSLRDTGVPIEVQYLLASRTLCFDR